MNILRSILLIIMAFSVSVSAQEFSICDDIVFTTEHEDTPYIVRYSFEVNFTNNSSETQCVGQDIYWWTYTTPWGTDSVPLSNNWYWEWGDDIILVGNDYYFSSQDLSTLYGRCIKPGETARLSLTPFRPIMDRLWIEKHQEYKTEKDMLLHFFQEAVLHLYHNEDTFISTCERTVHYCPELLECD